MTTDPIGQSDGLNIYSYTGGDPINAVDPWGLASVCQPVYHYVGEAVWEDGRIIGILTGTKLVNVTQNCIQLDTRGILPGRIGAS